MRSCVCALSAQTANSNRWKTFNITRESDLSPEAPDCLSHPGKTHSLTGEEKRRN